MREKWEGWGGAWSRPPSGSGRSRPAWEKRRREGECSWATGQAKLGREGEKRAGPNPRVGLKRKGDFFFQNPFLFPNSFSYLVFKAKPNSM